MDAGVLFPQLLTVPDVAEILCVPVSTVHHWAARGDGPPSFKVGKHRRFDAAEVRQWLDETKRRAAA
ncbi:MAG: helix-turn-helix domain-containing protein [Nocardioidaceae bacterium]|nr:helix-turn-helix domain-containing protein [Nocardioidaceae bacterium]NUS52481.1 helix-turn-helix domain-containing protein [Nocardioidaceae bacterium]